MYSYCLLYTSSIKHVNIKCCCQEIENIIIENTDVLKATFDVDVFYRGEALIEHIRCGANYDFLILDIELTRATGIDVGKYLRDENRNFHTQIIYCLLYTSVADAYKDKILDTVYIGGGTPTTLEAEQLDWLLTKLKNTFDWSQVKEFTVEAGRADSITPEKLAVLHQHGVCLLYTSRCV